MGQIATAPRTSPVRRSEFARCRGLEYWSGEKLDAEIAHLLDGHTIIEVGNAQVKRKEVLSRLHYDKASGARIGIESIKPPPYSTSFDSFTKKLIELWKQVGGKIKLTYGRNENKDILWHCFISDKDGDLVEMSSGSDLSITICAAFLTARKYNQWPIQPAKYIPAVHHWFLRDENGKVHHETEQGGRVSNNNGRLFPIHNKTVPEVTLKERIILACWDIIPVSEAGPQNILNPEPRRKKCR